MKKGPYMITFPSGKGGVGKTNLVASLAVALTQMGKRVMVLDGDLSLANLDLLFGVNPTSTLQHVLLGGKSLKEILVEGPLGIQIIPASSGVDELSRLDERERRSLIKEFKLLGRGADFLLIDTAPGLTPNVLDFVMASDLSIVVTTPEVTSITDAYATIKVISMRRPTLQLPLVVNMTGGEREASEVVERIRMVAARFLKVKVTSLGFIPSDQSVPQSVAKQRPFYLAFPYSPASQGIASLAQRLMEGELYCCVNESDNQQIG
jgi:flagellar biosynthesis protein FlhG